MTMDGEMIKPNFSIWVMTQHPTRDGTMGSVKGPTAVVARIHTNVGE